MSKFLFSVTLIVCSLFLGYVLQKLANAEVIRLPIALEDLRTILQKMENHGLPLKVVMILSAMPVAFTAIVATSIYDLDVDLTNSCFLFTTSCLILVLPVLYYVTR